MAGPTGRVSELSDDPGMRHDGTQSATFHLIAASISLSESRTFWLWQIQPIINSYPCSSQVNSCTVNSGLIGCSLDFVLGEIEREEVLSMENRQGHSARNQLQRAGTWAAVGTVLAAGAVISSTQPAKAREPQR